MAKNLEIANRHPDADLEIGLAEKALAAYLEVDLTANVALHLERMGRDAQMGFEANLRIGLRLLAVKQACPHGEFEGLVQDVGIGLRDARNCMQLAKAIATEGDANRRESLMGMGKSKALLLLASAPELREHIMDSPELLAQALESSKRDFEKQIKTLRKEVGDWQAKAEIKANHKLADAASHVVTPDIPYAVTDIRRETAALYAQAKLAVDGLNDIAPMLAALEGVRGCDAWIEPSLHQAFVAMRSLHAALGVGMAAWAQAYGSEAALPSAEHRAYYLPDEAQRVAGHFDTLVKAHASGVAKRAKQAANDRPERLGRKFKTD